MIRIFPYRGAILLGLAIIAAVSLRGQDTLRLTLPEAEKQFFDRNLDLLAERYNIDAATAAIIQARLYPNPSIELAGNIYNPQRKKFGDISNRTGEYTINVQQMIRLAGKRNKEILLAETNSRMAANQFAELLRTLKFTLRSDFYHLHYLSDSYRAYENQITSLEQLSKAYDELQTKGVVTLKDAIRIRSLLYSLKAEQTNLQNEMNEVQSELQLLLQRNDAWIAPHATAPVFSASDYPIESLIDTAYQHRFDLKLAENAVIYGRQNYDLQKALARPDLTLGGQFDKRGSFVDNATFLTVAMDLPFFHRNQGNIRAAKSGIGQAETVSLQKKLTVENEVRTAYAKALNTGKMLESIDGAFQVQFQTLLDGITENFRKKNISLLEFTDFNESYKNNILQFNQLQNARTQAIETLQFAIGKTLFN